MGLLAQVLPEWLEYLASIRQQVKIIVMSTPTGLVQSELQIKVRKSAKFSNRVSVSFVAAVSSSCAMIRIKECSRLRLSARLGGSEASTAEQAQQLPIVAHPSLLQRAEMPQL